MAADLEWSVELDKIAPALVSALGEMPTIPKTEEAKIASTKGNYGYRAAWMELVPNRKLVRAIELYADHVRFLRSLTLDDRKTREVVMRGLKRLFESLAAADGAAAAVAMRDHLLEAKRILGRALKPGQR